MIINREKLNFKTIFFSILVLLTVILLLLILFRSDTERTLQSKTYIISTGSFGGNYHEAGFFIEKKLNQITPDNYRFKVLRSNGSAENMNRLKNRFTDFAIVQRDVFVDHFLGEGYKIKNVSIISPLFQEKLLIYTHQNNHISFNEFRELTENQTKKLRIGITSLEGQSYKLFTQISDLLNLSFLNIDFVEGDYYKLSQKFKKKEIDIVITMSLPIKEIEKISSSLVYFEKNEIDLLTSRYRSFSQAILAGKSKYNTLGIWTLFVGLNRSINEIGDQTILDNLRINDNPSDYISTQIVSTIEYFNSSPEMFNKHLSNLSITHALSDSIKSNNKSIYFYLIIFVGCLLAWVFVSKFYISKGKKLHIYLWIRYNHIFIGVILIIIIYFLCIEYLIYCEKTFYNSNAIKSRVLDLTRSDLHIWNLVRIFADNDEGIFPYSLYGKFVTALSTYVLFLGIFAIPFIEYGVYKLIAKRRKGIMKIKDINHIIIAGWNHNTPKLITKLLDASTNYQKKSLKVVCVALDPGTILTNEDSISDLEKERKLTFIKGDIRNKLVAAKCNIKMAAAVILLAEEDTINADEKTLMRALSITKFCSNQEDQLATRAKPIRDIENAVFQARKELKSTYIIAEVNNEEFIDDLSNAGVNGIVNRGKIIDGILVQSLLNPGVSKLINNILSINGDTNEFYTVDLRNESYKHLRNKTFDELLLPLRQQKILLIAIKVVYLDETGKAIVDEEEIANLLKNDDLDRQVITNPINQGETRRKVDNDDQLIVLAANKQKLDTGLLRVTF